MNRYPKINEQVHVNRNSLPKELMENNIGQVIHRDGEYCYVQLNNTCIVVERYLNELESIETIY